MSVVAPATRPGEGTHAHSRHRSDSSTRVIHYSPQQAEATSATGAAAATAGEGARSMAAPPLSPGSPMSPASRRSRLLSALSYPQCRLFVARASSPLTISDFDLDALVLAAGGGEAGLDAAMQNIKQMSDDGTQMQNIDELTLAIAQRIQTAQATALLAQRDDAHKTGDSATPASAAAPAPSSAAALRHIAAMSGSVPGDAAALHSLVVRLLCIGLGGVDPALPLVDVLRALIKQPLSSFIRGTPPNEAFFMQAMRALADNMRRRVLARHLQSAPAAAVLLHPLPSLSPDELSSILAAAGGNLFWLFRHFNQLQQQAHASTDQDQSTVAHDILSLVQRVQQLHQSCVAAQTTAGDTSVSAAPTATLDADHPKSPPSPPQPLDASVAAVSNPAELAARLASLQVSLPSTLSPLPASSALLSPFAQRTSSPLADLGPAPGAVTMSPPMHSERLTVASGPATAVPAASASSAHTTASFHASSPPSARVPVCDPAAPVTSPRSPTEATSRELSGGSSSTSGVVSVSLPVRSMSLAAAPFVSSSDHRTRVERAVLLSALSYPRCKLFVHSSQPIQLTDAHLDMLLAQCGNVDRAVALLRALDQHQTKIRDFAHLQSALAASIQAEDRDELVQCLLYPRCTLFTLCPRPIEIEDADLDDFLQVTGSLALAVQAMAEFERAKRKFMSFQELAMEAAMASTVQNRKRAAAAEAQQRASRDAPRLPLSPMPPSPLPSSPASWLSSAPPLIFSPVSASASTSSSSAQSTLFPLLHRALQGVDVTNSAPLTHGMQPEHSKQSGTNDEYHVSAHMRSS